jgi:hypothetical protein
VLVTAQDGTTTKTYKIAFRIAIPDIAAQRQPTMLLMLFQSLVMRLPMLPEPISIQTGDNRPMLQLLTLQVTAL